MREYLALRSFASIAVCTVLLVTPAVASQTVTAAAPAVVPESRQSAPSDSNSVPAALLETLRKEQVALVLQESPRLDPQARASLMRSLKQHFRAGHVVKEKADADVVIAIGFFDEANLATPADGVSNAATATAVTEDEKKAAAKQFRVFVFRPGAPSETFVLYESAAVGRGGVSQRTGLDKRRAALDLAMKNLGLVASAGKR